MAKTTTRVRAGGRIVIPAAIRAAAGLRDGDDVQVDVGEGGEIRLIPLDRALSRAQDLLAPYLAGKPSLADELIAERRTEAARD